MKQYSLTQIRFKKCIKSPLNVCYTHEVLHSQISVFFYPLAKKNCHRSYPVAVCKSWYSHFVQNSLTFFCFHVLLICSIKDYLIPFKSVLCTLIKSCQHVSSWLNFCIHYVQLFQPVVPINQNTGMTLFHIMLALRAYDCLITCSSQNGM